VQVATWKDHHDYRDEDVAWLAHAARRADHVVITQKDAVKLRDRWPHAVPEPLVAVLDPDVVLLLEGIVDVNNNSPRFPVVRENLVDMMGLVKREGALVIIGTYPLLNPDGYRTAGAQNVPRLNDVIRQEANRLSVPVADHELANELAGQGPDGLHPNNIGYETMAGTWLAAIEALAETLGET